MDWEVLDTIRQFNQNTKEYMSAIKGIYNFFAHPLQSLAYLWRLLIEWSMYVGVTIVFICLVLHLIGVEKAAKYARITFAAYLVIKIFNWVGTEL